MRSAFHKMVLALAGVESGGSCRRCGEAILKSDSFGVSESVCRPCRFEAGA